MFLSKRPEILFRLCLPKQSESHEKAVIGRGEQLKELLIGFWKKNNHMANQTAVITLFVGYYF